MHPDDEKIAVLVERKFMSHLGEIAEVRRGSLNVIKQNHTRIGRGTPETELRLLPIEDWVSLEYFDERPWFLLGIRRHRFVFKMKDGKKFSWTSRWGEFEGRKEAVEKVLQFARSRGIHTS